MSFNEVSFLFLLAYISFTGVPPGFLMFCDGVQVAFGQHSTLLFSGAFEAPSAVSWERRLEWIQPEYQVTVGRVSGGMMSCGDIHQWYLIILFIDCDI
jgi:hypothetical protein